MSLAPVTSEPGKPSEGGVAIAQVESGSDAERKGLKAGDKILEIQGVEVKSEADVVKGVKRALDKKRPAVLMHIESDNAKRFVAVQLNKE